MFHSVTIVIVIMVLLLEKQAFGTTVQVMKLEPILFTVTLKKLTLLVTTASCLSVMAAVKAALIHLFGM